MCREMNLETVRLVLSSPSYSTLPALYLIFVFTDLCRITSSNARQEGALQAGGPVGFQGGGPRRDL